MIYQGLQPIHFQLFDEHFWDEKHSKNSNNIPNIISSIDEVDKPDKIRQHSEFLSIGDTMDYSTEATTLVTLTHPAAQAVQDVISQKNLQGYALRLFISGGGCSGYQYGLALDNNIRTEDTIVETDGIKLLIDEVSIKYVQGATVDYVEGMTDSGFKIINPNASSSCSCGQTSDSEESSTESNCACCG